MKAESEILIAAKAKISDPDKWTQGSFAKDKMGYEVSYKSPRAVCWCSMGAVASVQDGFRARALFKVCPGKSSVAAYNDKPTTTHADIMKLFDDAIALAKLVEADETEDNNQQVPRIAGFPEPEPRNAGLLPASSDDPW